MKFFVCPIAVCEDSMGLFTELICNFASKKIER